MGFHSYLLGKFRFPLDAPTRKAKVKVKDFLRGYSDADIESAKKKLSPFRNWMDLELAILVGRVVFAKKEISAIRKEELYTHLSPFHSFLKNKPMPKGGDVIRFRRYSTIWRKT